MLSAWHFSGRHTFSLLAFWAVWGLQGCEYLVLSLNWWAWLTRQDGWLAESWAWAWTTRASSWFVALTDWCKRTCKYIQNALTKYNTQVLTLIHQKCGLLLYNINLPLISIWLTLQRDFFNVKSIPVQTDCVMPAWCTKPGYRIYMKMNFWITKVRGNLQGNDQENSFAQFCNEEKKCLFFLK